MGIVWCDGKFIGENDFNVSPTDRGLCHGLSLFETLLAINGKPRFLREHLGRLRCGLERLGVNSVDLDEDGLGKAMISLLEGNGLQNGMSRVRFTLSLGKGPLDRIDNASSWAWMTVSPVDSSIRSLRMTLAPWKRDKESVLRGIKTGNYTEHLIALDMARREGFDEMLFYNTDDELCEASMANVFLIRKGGLETPSLDSACLAGVTRALLIRLAAQHGIPCRECVLRKTDVAKADAMFLTSSVKGPVRVSALQGKTFSEHPLFDVVRSLWVADMS